MKKNKTLYVVVTKKCQMRCPFCYMQFADIFSDKIANSEVSAKKIAEVAKSGGYNEIIFHGGECLMFPEIILEAINLIGKNNVEYYIQSNLAYDRLSDKQLEAIQSLGHAVGTSYSYERFASQPRAWENFKRNIKRLENLGIDYGVIVTLTEEHCMKEPPETFIENIKRYMPKTGKVHLERVQFSREECKKNPEKVKRTYKIIDQYLYDLIRLDREHTDAFSRMKDTICNDVTYFPTTCHLQVDTLDKEGLHHGCPSYVPRDPKKLLTCTDCKYMHYCGGDCENISVCAFPKKTFDLVNKILKEEKR